MRALGVVAVSVALVLVACGDDGDSDGDAAAFCSQLDRLSRNDPFQAFGDEATSADIETAFGALVDRAEELLEVAPPEARAAARDFAESAAALDELLEEVGYDGTAVDARAYREQQVTYTEAATRLERHLESEC